MDMKEAIKEYTKRGWKIFPVEQNGKRPAKRNNGAMLSYTDASTDADALIVFSCAGRILAFGPMMNQEIEGIKKVWNVPMVGMFSNAELARATGGNLEMHNLTTCCVALKEK